MRLIVTVLTIVLVSSLSLVKAQPIQIEKDSVKSEGEAGDIIAPKTYVKNQSSDTLKLYWKRSTRNKTDDWQKPGVCDKNNCYNEVDSAVFKLAPGEEGQLKINFYAYYFNEDQELVSVEGKGYLQLSLGIIDGDYPDFEKENVYFRAKTFNYSRIKDKSSESQFKLNAYPNPVKKSLNLEFNGKGSHEVVLFNVLGKPIKQKTFQSEKGMLITEDLDQGIYILRYQSPSGKEIVKRIHKE